MDLMDVYLGLKNETDNETISSHHNINHISDFKRKYLKMKGYRGKGMCSLCSAMASGEGYKFCVDQMRLCQDANVCCKGTK